MTKIVLIFIGAGFGGVLRYWVSGWVQSLWPTPFPTGTLVVNLLGCLAIGFLSGIFAGPVLIREEYKLAILVGLIGGFTTFSTFGQETFSLAANRELLLAGVNLLLSNVLGLAAVWLGLTAAKYLYST